MTVWLELGGRQRRVQLPDAIAAEAQYLVDGKAVAVDARMLAPGVLSLLVAGRQYRCVLDRDHEGDAVVVAGRRFAFSVADPRSLAAQNGSASGMDGPRAIRAPMPGRVVRVLVAVGDLVEEQQGLLVIEAMKMQNELKSPKQGRVIRLTAADGATVAAGDALVVIE
jgi:biotin carboxyl carrier protein